MQGLPGLSTQQFNRNQSYKQIDQNYWLLEEPGIAPIAFT